MSNDELARLVDQLAECIATHVADKLCAGNIAGFIDQSESPLGRRRHIEAVRTGKLPGKRVGRRYLVRREDLDLFVATNANAVQERPQTTDRIDSLAAELGHKRRK